KMAGACCAHPIRSRCSCYATRPARPRASSTSVVCSKVGSGSRASTSEMLRRPGRILLLSGIALLIALIGGRALADFYTDALWFAELGYGSVFWTRIAAGVAVRAVAGTIAAGIVFVNLWAVARQVGPVQLRRRYGNLEIAEQVP